MLRRFQASLASPFEYSSSGMQMVVERLWKDTDRKEKALCVRRETISIASLSTPDTSWRGPRDFSNFRGERPKDNSLNHVAAV